jgi:hypothetical protein
MAYVSRTWQAAWTYDPAKRDWDAKVANILNDGMDVKVRHVAVPD